MKVFVKYFVDDRIGEVLIEIADLDLSEGIQVVFHENVKVLSRFCFEIWIA